MSTMSVESVIEAPQAVVWDVLTSPEHWPRWTTSISRAELLDGRFGPHTRVRIHQPRMRPAVWTVTEYRPGTSFTWVATQPGVETTGVHELTPLDDGRTRLRLELRQRGGLSRVVDRLLGTRTRRYVALEAEGLKRAAEHRVTDGAPW